MCHASDCDWKNSRLSGVIFSHEPADIRFLDVMATTLFPLPSRPRAYRMVQISDEAVVRHGGRRARRLTWRAMRVPAMAQAEWKASVA